MSETSKMASLTYSIIAVFTLLMTGGCANTKSTHGCAITNQQFSGSFLTTTVTNSVGDKVADAAVKATMAYLAGVLPLEGKNIAANAGAEAARQEATSTQIEWTEADTDRIRKELLARLGVPVARR